MAPLIPHASGAVLVTTLTALLLAIAMVVWMEVAGTKLAPFVVKSIIPKAALVLTARPEVLALVAARPYTRTVVALMAAQIVLDEAE